MNKEKQNYEQNFFSSSSFFNSFHDHRIDYDLIIEKRRIFVTLIFQPGNSRKEGRKEGVMQKLNQKVELERA